MKSIVLELQRDAMNDNIPVSTLLRKAMVVATKLNIDKFKSWIGREQRGYTNNDDIPAYRTITGVIKAHNPYHGWIPVILSNSLLTNKLSSRLIGQPVDELEYLCHEGGKEGYQLPFSPEVLQKVFGESEAYQLGLLPTLIVSKSGILGILGTIRNEILNWSLKLEERGILGDDMTFSEEEISKAKSIIYNIHSFSGVLGNVSSSNVQVGDYASIHATLKEMGVAQTERNELENILDELKAVEPDKKPSIMAKGLEWVNRNRAFLGGLYKTISGWFGNQD